MRILKAAVLYFGLVFAAGFVLGAIRTFWIVPRVGTRTAELMESPLMLVVTILAARWVSRRLSVASTAPIRLAMGFLGLAFLLLAELCFVLEVQKLSLPAYLESRDLVAGTVYVILLGLFAFMPVLIRES